MDIPAEPAGSEPRILDISEEPDEVIIVPVEWGSDAPVEEVKGDVDISTAVVVEPVNGGQIQNMT